MSTIKVTNLLHGSSASNNVVLASDGTTAIPTVKATTQLLVGGVSSTANGGTLQISNGITFPATQSACSDVNTLDDYEEGTYSFTVRFGTGAFSNADNSSQSFTGYYTKVGRLVSIQGTFQINTKSAATGNLEITGLPFSSTYHVPVLLGGVFEMGATSYANARISDGNGTLIEFYQTSTAGVRSRITNTNCNNGFSFQFATTYVL